MPLSHTAHGLAALLLTCTLAACSPPESGGTAQSKAGSTSGANRHIHLVSRELSEAISAEAYPAKLRGMQSEGMHIDANAQEVRQVIQVTARLINQAEYLFPHSGQWEWDVHVVENDEVNAWCMAGGKMAVFTGLLQAVDHQEDKLAAVMGHEMAHALLEHSRRAMGRDLLLSSGLWIASKSLKIGAQRSDQIAEDLSLAFQPFQRAQEREADALGLELMARAGFNLDIGSRIWEDLRKDRMNKGQRRLAAFYSSHPMDDERLASMSEHARQLQRTGVAP